MQTTLCHLFPFLFKSVLEALFELNHSQFCLSVETKAKVLICRDHEVELTVLEEQGFREQNLKPSDLVTPVQVRVCDQVAHQLRKIVLEIRPVQVERSFVNDSVFVCVEYLLLASDAAFLLAIEVSDSLRLIASVCSVLGQAHIFYFT